MNRLAPLISRRQRNEACFSMPAPRAAVQLDEAARWLEDIKLFAMGWVSGLVVFGTLFA